MNSFRSTMTLMTIAEASPSTSASSLDVVGDGGKDNQLRLHEELFWLLEDEDDNGGLTERTVLADADYNFEEVQNQNQAVLQEYKPQIEQKLIGVEKAEKRLLRSSNSMNLIFCYLQIDELLSFQLIGR